MAIMKTSLAICVLFNAAVFGDIVRYKDTYWIAEGSACKNGLVDRHCVHYSDCTENPRKGHSKFCKYFGSTPVLCCIENDEPEKESGEYYHFQVDEGHTKFPPLNRNPPSKYHETTSHSYNKPTREAYDEEDGPIWDIIPIHNDSKKQEQSNYHYKPHYQYNDHDNYDQHVNHDYHHKQQHHGYPYYQANYETTRSLSTQFNNIFTSISTSIPQTQASQTMFSDPTTTTSSNRPIDPQSDDNINRAGNGTGTANTTLAISNNLPTNSTEGLNIQVPFYRPTLANSTSLRRCVEFFRQVPLVKGRHTPILGGMAAKPKQFPHLALLGYGEPDDIQWLCGGSLISENYVLTAAHCIFPRRAGSVRYVRIGELDLSSTTDDADEREFTVGEAITHPLYNPFANYHDIALIRLNASVGAFSSYIRPICLPTSRMVDNANFVVAGWGLTEVRGPRATILQRTTLKHVDNARCRRIYGTPTELRNGILEEIQLCADGGGERRDTCQGDSGGPLQYTNYDYETPDFLGFVEVVGVTSFGPKACGLTAGVYTRVLPYVRWIENIVFPN